MCSVVFQVVNPKSDDQRKRLMESIKNILLFRSLDHEQMQEVLDAMFEKSVSQPRQFTYLNLFNVKKLPKTLHFFKKIDFFFHFFNKIANGNIVEKNENFCQLF